MSAETRTWLQHAGSRGLSLLLAVPLSLVLMIHPSAMLDANGHYSHGLLSLAMWGVASGFIHGVGFDPRAPVWRWLFNPVLGWLLMGVGYGILSHTLGAHPGTPPLTLN